MQEGSYQAEELELEDVQEVQEDPFQEGHCEDLVEQGPILVDMVKEDVELG